MGPRRIYNLGYFNDRVDDIYRISNVRLYKSKYLINKLAHYFVNAIYQYPVCHFLNKGIDTRIYF